MMLCLLLLLPRRIALAKYIEFRGFYAGVIADQERGNRAGNFNFGSAARGKIAGSDGTWWWWCRAACAGNFRMTILLLTKAEKRA